MKFLPILFLLILGLIVILFRSSPVVTGPSTVRYWSVQSIDTMKYSRDLARSKLNDGSFEKVIDNQLKLISGTGATHVAIGTPYDQEFLPFLQKWVRAARKYHLSVWFRGNWAGWEGWFGYPRISRAEHLAKTTEFINRNLTLFADGDIFTACPECENGGPGDPRTTGDVAGHRRFLIDLYQSSFRIFSESGKAVRANYFSMNADVAALIMDRDTTHKLGGVVVVDHYVTDAQKLAEDLKSLADKSGGRIILGEMGAPIPDLHGKMDDSGQAGWLENALAGISRIPQVEGVNYWTSFGGTTRIWTESGQALPAVTVISSYFRPPALTINVKNEAGQAISGASVSGERSSVTNQEGEAYLPLPNRSWQLIVSAPGYRPHGLTTGTQPEIGVILQKSHEDLWFKLLKLTRQLLRVKIP